jgi:hypothetical protein
MPQNPMTGKTDRHLLSEGELMKFRIEQARQRRGEVKRGKQRVSGSADTAESEGSVPGPSPLGLSALKTLTLHSGESSAAHTPADSPDDNPRLLLPEGEEPALPSAQKARKVPKPSKSKCSFWIILQHPPLSFWQVSWSRYQQSPGCSNRRTGSSRAPRASHRRLATTGAMQRGSLLWSVG